MNTKHYIHRALQLARLAEGNTSPNPMVGAVIVDPAGRIIGEGYHRRCGEGHAEVNAVASVADKSLLADCTMYVTLEPCSHYGKTPPCSKLIIDSKIPRVVVGCLDPNEKVSGRGVRMLREAGVDVTVLDGEISEACRGFNKRFMTAHSLRRPYITLKWAQSADGKMAGPDGKPWLFSTPLSSLMMHRERSLNDAILTGSGTVLADNPRLTVRGWEGRSPRRIVLDRRGRVAADAPVLEGNAMHITDYESLDALMAELFKQGITSVMVEAGPTLLSAFIDADLWDEARIETAPYTLPDGTRHAPMLPPSAILTDELTIDGNLLQRIKNSSE